ncbi:2297_t:CDS:2, partial [Paraglomus brasilianum]
QIRLSEQGIEDTSSIIRLKIFGKGAITRKAAKKRSSKIDNIIWDRSEEIANAQVHLTYSEFLAKINIKINLIDDIINSEGKKGKCHNDYDVSFNEFIDRSSEEMETGTTAVESGNDKPVEMALETMALNLRMVKTDIDLESIADELQYTPKDE